MNRPKHNKYLGSLHAAAINARNCRARLISGFQLGSDALEHKHSDV